MVRYVVRAKAGGRQSTKDGGAGKTIKSAGSSIRRHNEAALEKVRGGEGMAKVAEMAKNGRS